MPTSVLGGKIPADEYHIPDSARRDKTDSHTTVLPRQAVVLVVSEKVFPELKSVARNLPETSTTTAIAETTGAIPKTSSNAFKQHLTSNKYFMLLNLN
jgi:hypothetical protein